MFVGLDVHTETIAVVVAEAGRGEVRSHGVIANTPRTVARVLKKLGPASALRVCYEAGSCGDVLYRQLTQLGIACTVVAPALIPAKPGEKIKTDRKDAAKLARLHRAGELTAVAAPTPEQEALRDLTRARQAAQQDVHRVRQRLRTLLLRLGVAEPTTTKRWSARYRSWLTGLTLDQASQQLVLTELRDALAEGEARVERLTAAVAAQATSGPFADLIGALTSLRGIGVVTAVTVVAELGDPGRFDHPRQLMAFAGLVPSEHSSGGREQRERITKTGNACALRDDGGGLALSPAAAGQPGVGAAAAGPERGRHRDRWDRPAAVAPPLRPPGGQRQAETEGGGGGGTRTLGVHLGDHPPGGGRTGGRERATARGLRPRDPRMRTRS
jgi:transposase